MIRDNIKEIGENIDKFELDCYYSITYEDCIIEFSKNNKVEKIIFVEKIGFFQLIRDIALNKKEKEFLTLKSKHIIRKLRKENKQNIKDKDNDLLNSINFNKKEKNED